MEQWNKKTYSLKYIMTERYACKLIEKINAQSDGYRISGLSEVKGESLSDKIISLMTQYAGKLPELNSYIEYRKALLYEMLDILLDNQRELLHPENNSKDYFFNDDNKLFFNFLLDFKEDKDNQENIYKFYDMKFASLPVDVQDLLIKGLRDIAKNENTALDIEWVEARIAKFFDVEYQRTADMINDLDMWVGLYSIANYGKDDSEKIYKILQKGIKELIEIIPKDSKKTYYTMSSLNNRKTLALSKNAEKKKRRARALKSWDTRRKK